jgi:DNA replication protein DnaC
MLAAGEFVCKVIERGASHDRQGHTLTFCGVSGTGKTMLANCILNELRKNKWGFLDGVQGHFNGTKLVRADWMKRDWRKISDGFKAGDYEIIEDMESVFILMLDDIGADYDPSSNSTSKLDRVLRSRAGKWTILTCNLTLSQIAETLDTRIASFLIRDENKVVEIEAVDYSFQPAQRRENLRDQRLNK